MSLNKSKELREIAKKICRDLRKNSTKAENIFWKRLRNRKFMGKKFYRQYPFFYDTLGKESFYVVDFYCHEEKLVIELDGEIHQYQRENDKLRTDTLENKGIQVIRIKNKDVENDSHDVLNIIEKIITQPQPFS